MLHDLTARPRWYVLDGHTPVVAANVVAWAQWFGAHSRETIVASTTVGGATITTKFTGMDRGVMLTDPPTLFETLVRDDISEKGHGWASTWADALACHQRAIAARQSAAAVLSTHQVWHARAWATLRRVVNRHRPAPFSSPAAKESPQWPLE